MKVQLIYRYFFKTRTFSIDVPQSFQELSGNQFHTVALFFLHKIGDKEFISRFFGLKMHLVNRLDKFSIYKLLECSQFISSRKNPVNHFLIDRIPCTNLVAPLFKLKDVSLLQYMYLDKCFNGYVSSNSLDDIYRFIAACYLPETCVNTAHDLRKRLDVFNKINMEKQLAAVIRNTDDVFCFAIFLNFIFIREWLSRCFPFLFSDSMEKESNSVKHTSSWLDIFDSLVGENIPDSQAYERMPCMDAFRLINNRIRKYRENEKRNI